MDKIKLLKLSKKILAHKIHRNFGIGQPVPYKLILSVTYSCNSRCKTCNIWQEYIKNPNKKKEELTPEGWEKLFKNINDNLFWLSVTGGEPFLRRDLEKIILSAAKECKNLSIISMNTNGLLPNRTYNTMKYILSKLTNGVEFHLAISLDGFEKTHDKIRGKKDSYKKAMETYKLLSRLSEGYRNFYLSREVTLSKYNLKEILHLVQDLNEKEVPFTFTFAQSSDYYKNNDNVSLKNLKKNQIIRLLNLIDVANGKNADNKENFIKRRFLNLAKNYYKNTRKQVIPCYSGFSSVVIDPYGDVYPCVMFQQKCGTLRDSNFDIKKIVESGQIREVQEKIKNEKCPNCWTPCEAYGSIIQNFLI